MLRKEPNVPLYEKSKRMTLCERQDKTVSTALLNNYCMVSIS